MNRLQRRLMLSALEIRTVPASYTVDALTDTGAGIGLAGDLRYCIASANMNPGPDIIDASGVTGTILLNGELPTINDDLTVFGPGIDLLSIDGMFGTRLLQVNTSGGKQVDFSNLQFTNGGTTGSGGVALVNNATATFTNCVLNNSFANLGGLVAGTASSTIAIISCTLSGSSATAGGGAVYSAGGVLSIRNSTLSGNNTGSVGSGGAVVLGGASAATIINSTLSGNSAGAHGGAIRTSSAFTGQLHLKNSTITQNAVASSTGTGRGVSRGGSSGSIIIDSTIVAQNFGGAVNTSDVNGAIMAAYSLFGTTDAAIITGNGNFKGTNMSPENAKLGPLADNGGPTLTHMPADDSPVREAGVDQDAQSEDQRGPGFARLENYAIDIGAVETLNFKPMAANIDVIVDEASPNTTFQFTVTYFDPRGSMLVDYSSLGTGDLYIPGPNGYFAFPTFVSAVPGVDAQTIVATYEIPVPVNGKAGWDLSDNGIYSLIASPNEVFDKDTPTPNAGDTVAFAFLIVDIPVIYPVDEISDVVDMDYSEGHLSLREALSIANADGVASKIVFDPGVFAGDNTITMTGGEMKIDAAVTIEGPAAPLTLDANGKSRIFNTAGAPTKADITLSRLTLTNGKTDNHGGGIYAPAQHLELDFLTITNCAANGVGGGLFVNAANGPARMSDCIIDNNVAPEFGGGLTFYNGHLTLERSIISNNKATAAAGGLYFQLADFVIDGCTISGNVAGDGIYDPRGGGIEVNLSNGPRQFVILNSTFSGNRAAGPMNSGTGGAIAMHYVRGELTIVNSTLTDNTALEEGGGIYLVSNTFSSNDAVKLTVHSTIVAGNMAPSGPDLYYPPTGGTPPPVLGTNNLIGIADFSNVALAPGNLTGTKAAPLNAQLAPLADNGGPTKSHALLSGSPALNAGTNTVGLAYDQRGTGYSRTIGSGTDIGAFEVQAVPATVTSVEINDGGAQRSRVTSLTVTFDQIVDLPVAPANAFDLVRQSDGKHPALSASVDNTGPGTVVTLTFQAGDAVDFDSLADGRYTLTIDDMKVINANGELDGDGDGSAGGAYELIGTPANGLFRLYGDSNGDGTVNGADFLAFRLAFLGTSAVFDFNADGQVTGADFLQFRLRFLQTV